MTQNEQLKRQSGEYVPITFKMRTKDTLGNILHNGKKKETMVDLYKGLPSARNKPILQNKNLLV